MVTLIFGSDWSAERNKTKFLLFMKDAVIRIGLASKWYILVIT
jgi:hypothetical protein